MGELAASLAHEIKQPIAAPVINAKACVRWLRRDAPDIAEASEAASRMVNDATRAADILDRVRSLYRRDTTQRELVDVNGCTTRSGKIQSVRGDRQTGRDVI